MCFRLRVLREYDAYRVTGNNVIILIACKKSTKLLLCMAGRGAGAQSVTVKPTGCGFDPHTRR